MSVNQGPTTSQPPTALPPTIEKSVEPSAAPTVSAMPSNYADRAYSSNVRSKIRTRTYETKAEKIAKVMFTRKASRITALTLLLAIVIIGGLCIGGYFCWQKLVIDVVDLQKMVDSIDRMKKNGRNVSANCEYESDINSSFYQDTSLWNVDLCQSSCGRTAFAFRRDRVNKNRKNGKNDESCLDRIDTAQCHSNNTDYCKAMPSPKKVKDLFQFCGGINSMMPSNGITGDNVFGLSVSLLTESSGNYTVPQLDKIQTEVLTPFIGRHLLGQSLIVRCPKCMVTSRCFKPPEISNPLYKEKVLRQLTTLRPGFPFYAQTCDMLEVSETSKFNQSEACPRLE